MSCTLYFRYFILKHSDCIVCSLGDFRMAASYKSPVWDHFTQLPDTKEAKCVHCSAVVKCSGNTSNCMSHLKTHHVDIYNVVLPRVRKNKRRRINVNCSMLLDVDYDSCESISSGKVKSNKVQLLVANSFNLL